MALLYNTIVQCYSSVKKVFLKILQHSQENTCVGASFLIKLQALTKKETPTQLLSCEFYKIFKIAFLCTTHPVATSERAVTKKISYMLIKFPTSYCKRSHPASEKKTKLQRKEVPYLQNQRKVGFKSPSRCQNSFN